MNRFRLPKHQGQRELVYVFLLVVPIAAIGFYLAAIEVLVDPPPDITPTATALMRDATPHASPIATPLP